MFKITETMKTYDYLEVAKIINGRCTSCSREWEWPRVGSQYIGIDGRSLYELQRDDEAYVLIKKEAVR